MKNSDYKIKSEKQYEALTEVRNALIKPFVLKILKEGEVQDIESAIKHFANEIKEYK